jgi:hypothetical protein
VEITPKGCGKAIGGCPPPIEEFQGILSRSAEDPKAGLEDEA